VGHGLGLGADSSHNCMNSAKTMLVSNLSRNATCSPLVLPLLLSLAGFREEDKENLGAAQC